MAKRGGSIERVRAAAEAAGLALAVHEMPESTRSAADAAQACGTSVAQIVKSLVFRTPESGGAVLLLVSGANRVDEALLASLLGEPIEPMDARTIRDVTGFAIGGVAPLGSKTPLPTYMDADLLRFPTIWAAAGSPNAVFETEPHALARATRAEILSFR